MKLFCFFLLLLLPFQSAVSQTQNDIERSKTELSAPLLDQLQTILDQGENYSSDSIPFEVIKRRYLVAFGIHLKDSLYKYNNLSLSTVQENESLAQQKRLLLANLKNAQDSIKTLNNYKDKLSLLGIKISQTAFQWVFWIVILALLLVIGLLTKHFYESSYIQKQLVIDKEMANEMLDDFRKKALTREQKLNRKILDLEKQTAKNN